MSFRSEVRTFIQKMELAFTKEKAVVQEQSKMILILQKQNEDLLNRLMARDFPELQTYPTVNFDKGKDTYDFEEDEENAGLIIDVENHNEAV